MPLAQDSQAMDKARMHLKKILYDTVGLQQYTIHLPQDKNLINTEASPQWRWLEDTQYKHFHFWLQKPHLHPFVAAQIYHRRGSAEGNVYFISVAVPILNG